MKTFRTLCVLLFLLESHVTLSCLIWIWIGVWATDHDVTGSLKTHPFRVYFTLIWRLGPWRASSSLVHPLRPPPDSCNPLCIAISWKPPLFASKLLEGQEKRSKCFHYSKSICNWCTRGIVQLFDILSSKLENMCWKIQFYSIFGLSR